MASQVDDKIKELQEVMQEKQEKTKMLQEASDMTFKLGLDQVLEVVQRVVSNVSEKISTSILVRLQETVERLSQPIEEKLADIQDIKADVEGLKNKEVTVNVPDKVTVNEIEKLIDGVKRLNDKETFPKDVAKKILNMVDAKSMIPLRTLFDRSPTGQIRGVTEEYGQFTVTTSYTRDAGGNIRSITSEVS